MSKNAAEKGLDFDIPTLNTTRTGRLRNANGDDEPVRPINRRAN